MITQTNRNEEYRDGKLVQEDVVEVDVTQEVVEYGSHQVVRDVYTNNKGAKAGMKQIRQDLTALADASQAANQAPVTTIAQARQRIGELAQINRQLALTLRTLLAHERRQMRAINRLISLTVREDLLLDEDIDDEGDDD